MRVEFRKILSCINACIFYSVMILVSVSLLLRTSFMENQKAFLYRLLIMDMICFSFLLCGTFLLCLKRKTILKLSFSSNVLCVGMSALLIALFLSLGPMTIERSYTIYFLADMTDHAETIYTTDDIKTRFIEGYIEGAKESQKRINEQVAIGNMEEIDGGYRITEKGKRLVKIFRLVEKIFPVPDKNSIYPNG